MNPLDAASENESQENWYFTFGSNHAHPNGYVRLFGTFNSAREEMFRRFGPKWSMQYDEETFLPQIKCYNLYQVRID